MGIALLQAVHPQGSEPEHCRRAKRGTSDSPGARPQAGWRGWKPWTGAKRAVARSSARVLASRGLPPTGAEGRTKARAWRIESERHPWVARGSVPLASEEGRLPPVFTAKLNLLESTS